MRFPRCFWFAKSGVLFRASWLIISWIIVACAETAFATSAESHPLTAEQANAPAPPIGISANPGAVDQITGTGLAGEWLGFKKDSGVFLGGVWAADTNCCWASAQIIYSLWS